LSERLTELESILGAVTADPTHVPREVRKRFWAIVRDIKRDTNPGLDEVTCAAQVRDVFFETSRGGVIRTSVGVGVETILGIVLSIIPFWWSLTLPLDWTNILGWALGDWGVFALRFIFVFIGIALFYPWGRLLAGRWAGIRILGLCRDQYYEPTLKIDYVSFLLAKPSKRKWFFFISGIWTAITSLVYWAVGFVLVFDFTGLIPALFILLFEARVIIGGSPKDTGGEMSHYNREKRIEQQMQGSG
jgi:hypothetical protein